MTINEILELGKMGYTKDDIEKMSAGDPEEPKKEEPKKEEPKKEEPKKEEPKKEEPKKEEPKQDPGYSSLAQSIDNLIKTIQASNITNSNNKSGPEETAEDILGSIIMPPLKKGEK